MLLLTASGGACFVAIRYGLADAPVLWFAAMRALLAGAVVRMASLAPPRALLNLAPPKAALDELALAI